jgi:hypothetical protein
MMISQRFGHALAAAVFAFAVGCGDDDDGGGGSGVDSSKTGEDLSDDEAKKLCESVASKAGALTDVDKEQTCTIGAAIQTSDKAACEAAAKQCAMLPDNGEDNGDGDDDSDDCATASDDLDGCKATVGEIEACFNAFADKLEEFNSITCDDAGKVNQQDLLATPDECAAVQQKCPKLLENEDDGGNVEAGG